MFCNFLEQKHGFFFEIISQDFVNKCMIIVKFRKVCISSDDSYSYKFSFENLVIVLNVFRSLIRGKKSIILRAGYLDTEWFCFFSNRFSFSNYFYFFAFIILHSAQLHKKYQKFFFLLFFLLHFYQKKEV